MFSKCTHKLNCTAPDLILRAVTQPFPPIILNLKQTQKRKIKSHMRRRNFVLKKKKDNPQNIDFTGEAIKRT